MPPKKKKSDSKASTSGTELETADQTEWKALKIDADRLHKQSKKEEHDFNEFQQQREKLNYFWIVEKKKLEDKRAELRNKEREFRAVVKRHGRTGRGADLLRAGAGERDERGPTDTRGVGDEEGGRIRIGGRLGGGIAFGRKRLVADEDDLEEFLAVGVGGAPDGGVGEGADLGAIAVGEKQLGVEGDVVVGPRVLGRQFVTARGGGFLEQRDDRREGLRIGGDDAALELDGENLGDRGGRLGVGIRRDGFRRWSK